MQFDQDIVSVIGGMGPLASAAFVSSVYERTTCVREQQMPRLVLWSDPLLPDRTTALRDGREDVLARELLRAIEQCDPAGGRPIVICCVTAHAVLPLLPARVQDRVVSLVDAILETVVQRQQPQLVLSSAGTRRSRMLERHPLWHEACRWLHWPDQRDHERVHQAIYEMKFRGGAAAAARLVESLLRKHALSSFVAACTELHLVTRYWGRHPLVDWIDPLDIVADRLVASLTGATPGAAEAS